MTQTLDVTVLGCGSSGGVPRVGGQWGVCDPVEPKNRRSRCSLLVQAWQGDEPSDSEKTTLLIDTSPDIREQLLRANVTHLDAIAYTHDHADQSHGIDDVRALVYLMRKKVPAWMDGPTRELLTSRFDYIFEMPEGKYHPPIMEARDIVDDEVFEVEGPGGTLRVEPLRISHGFIPALGFRIGPVVYTPDIHDLSDEIGARIEGAGLWVVDGLRYHDHPTHFHVDKALSWLAKTRVKRGVITNMHIDLDYQTLRDELPPIAIPGYDGLTIRLQP